MEIGKTLHFIERDDWRAWLAKNSTKEKEIWLIFFKKHTGKPTLPYNESVEEALCYGWIDGIEKRLDDERYVLRFSPRRKGSVLSPSNVERLKRLITEGKMTQAGLDAVAHAFDPKKDM